MLPLNTIITTTYNLSWIPQKFFYKKYKKILDILKNIIYIDYRYIDILYIDSLNNI